MMDEFVIPPAGGGETTRYNKLPEHQLPRKLEECERAVCAGRHDVVYEYYPVLHQVLSSTSSSLMDLSWPIIIQGVSGCTEDILRLDLTRQDNTTKHNIRNSLKMWTYLAVRLALHYESEVSAVVTGKVGKRKTTSSKPAWNERRLKLIQLLWRLYSSELKLLWEPPLVSTMEDFSNLLMSVCYRVLENPSVTREKTLTQGLANILATAATKYGLMLSVALKLIQLLQHFEHLCNVVGVIVGVAARSQSGISMVTTIVREIGSKDPADLVMDVGGTKTLASFLVCVGHELPQHMLPVVSCLLPHLNGESVTFRNGVLAVLGEVICQLPCSDEGPMTVEARDRMIQHLLGHIHDTHALVRVKALHIFLLLADIQVVPLPVIPVLLERVQGRLRDKSSLVRKAGLQLLSTLLSKNPYSAKLQKSLFVEKLTEEECLYNAMVADDIEGEESSKSRTIIDYLKAALDFTCAVEKCVPLAVDLLKSKVTSDVLEAMEFLRICQLFKIEGAEEGTTKCLALIWSQDELVRKGVVATYDSIYLAAEEVGNKKVHIHRVLNNLLELISKATTGQKASLERLVEELMKAKFLPEGTVKELWEIYCRSSEDKQVLASVLLSMVTNSPEIKLSTSLLDKLLDTGLSSSSGILLATHTCTTISRLKDAKETSRLPWNHKMFERTVHLLQTHYSSGCSSLWMPLCEQAIQMLYMWADHPDKICQNVLQDLAQTCFSSKGGINSMMLARLLHCVGHVSQWQLLHCEHTIYNHRRQCGNSDKEEPQAKKEADEDIGIMAGEDQDGDLIKRVMEMEVAGTDGFLLVFEPLVVSIIANPSKYPCERLQTAAALALAKFMLMSSSLCEKYLQLLFTVLEKSEVATIRANLIVAASDLVCRFPNTIEPWTPLMYNRLKDDEIRVRKNAMMVLTHLILNDMVKVRGQISSMALCLKDEDSSVTDMAHMFFFELSLKGNTLYNVVPDIISQLSDPSANIPSATFRDVVGHLFKLIKKEKQQESLIEKLCHRLRAVREVEQAQNLTYCLSLVVPTEKGLIKLQENFCCYRDQLLDGIVEKHILNYTSKAKKIGKNEVKVLAEELENRMNEYSHRGCEERTRVSIDPLIQNDTHLHV